MKRPTTEEFNAWPLKKRTQYVKAKKWCPCSADLFNANLRGVDLCGADLHGADLRGVDLCGADLRGADLFNANLRNANLDYSCWPLWCGSLEVEVDDQMVAQLAYHLARVCGHSRLGKKLLKLKTFRDVANNFQRSEELGKV